jgi:hypothetical protein
VRNLLLASLIFILNQKEEDNASYLPAKYERHLSINKSCKNLFLALATFNQLTPYSIQRKEISQFYVPAKL